MKFIEECPLLPLKESLIIENNQMRFDKMSQKLQLSATIISTWNKEYF